MNLIVLRAAAVFVLVSVGCSASIEGDSSRDDRTPGVGFRLLDLRDTSRPYFAVTPESPRPESIGRPMQVAVWYPARIGFEARMTLGRYVDWVGSENTGDPPSAASGAAARLDMLSDPYTDGGTLRQRFDEPTGAYWEAPPDTGSFPVAVYAPGSGASWLDNYALAESLAARGYVVLASRSRGLRHPDMSWTAAGIEAQTRDLEFLYGVAQELPGADPTRLAVIGRSWGAIAAVVFAHRNYLTDAFVSLDGTISYNMDTLLESYPEIPAGSTVRVPGFVAVGLKRSESATPIDRTHYFEDVDNADVYHVEYRDLQHFAFSSLMIDRYGGARSDSAGSRLHDSFARLADDVGSFLDAYVKDDARNWDWEDSSAREVRMRKGPGVRPAFDQYSDDFSRTALDRGPQEAIALYERFRDSGVKVFSANSLNRVLAEYLVRGEYDWAQSLATFAGEQYPDKGYLHVTIARAWWLSGDPSRAIEVLVRVLESNPGDSQALKLRNKINETPNLSKLDAGD